MGRPRAYLCSTLMLVGTALAAVSSAQAQPAEEFFRNKRELIFITSSNVGGGYDSYSRLLSRYLTKYLPGNPRYVVQNMLGGGGVHYFDKKNVTQTPLEPANGAPAPAPPSTYESKSQTQFGLNGGAGVAFAVGRTALFLESRYFSAFTDNTNSDWIPIILGVKWR